MKKQKLSKKGYGALVTSKSQLFTMRNISFLLGACAFPIYSWAIFRFLERMTGWLYYLDLWEVISLFAYTQAFALLESVLICAGILLLAMIVPVKLSRTRFIALGCATVLLTAGWVIAAQYNDGALRELPRNMVLVWMSLYVLSMGLVYFFTFHYEWFEKALVSLGERLSVLLYLYLPLSFVSLAIIVLRNI